MKKLFFLTFLGATLLSSAWASDITVYFSPNGGCEPAVVAAINHARQTVDIAMYYLSSSPIAHALIKAQKKGVRIRIVLDQGQEIESASKSTYLVNHGFDVRYHLGFGLMHNKFAVMDGQSLITGSFNWTKTADERNEENMLVITDAETIALYQRRFTYLWQTSRRDARNAKGLDIVPSWTCTTFHVFCAEENINAV